MSEGDAGLWAAAIVAVVVAVPVAAGLVVGAVRRRLARDDESPGG